MNAVAGSFSGSALRAASVVDLCTTVDMLGAHTGQLMLSGAARDGVVFVERGRVCWAAARGLAARLTELLAAGAGVGSADLDVHYRHCKERRVPLGEHLVSAGVVSEDKLSAALRQHTVESIRAMTGDDVAARFVPASQSGYAARFSFAPVDLLVSVNAVSIEPSLNERLTSLVRRQAAHVEWAAAFVRGTGASPSAVTLLGTSLPGTRDLSAVASWASSALDVAAALHGGPTMLASVDRSGRANFALAVEGGLIAGVAPNRAAAARVFSDHSHALAR